MTKSSLSFGQRQELESQTLQKSRPRSLLANLKLSIVPSYLQNTRTAIRADSGLAALDGLRGLACLAVVNQHYTSTFTSKIYHFGWGTFGENKDFAQLPFIKIAFAGSAHVFTFFVLSGYVLSYKPIKQMQSRSVEIQKTLSSSIFRRGMRLFIPAFTMTIVVAIIAQLGVYLPAQAAADQGLMDHLENIPQQEQTLTRVWQKIWNDITLMTNITDWGYLQPSLHQHLWTIIIEFRVSMLLYLLQTGTARLRPWARCLVAGYVFYWFCNTLTPVGSQTALFFAGMILAECDVALAAFRETYSGKVAWSRNRTAFIHYLDRFTDPSRVWWRSFHFVLFLLGLYFLSCPYNSAEQTPVYQTLIRWLNPSWYKALEHSYWLWTLGAIFLLSSASHSRDIRWVYNNAFSQYLGKISFALYLVHGPVLHCVSYGLLPLWVRITEPFGGRSTQLGFFLQWLMGLVVSYPVVFYFADVAYRLLDVPSVRFARWCEEVLEVPAWRTLSASREKA